MKFIYIYTYFFLSHFCPIFYIIDSLNFVKKTLYLMFGELVIY